MENSKPYEKYKDSGIAWLGEIPEHWVCWKLSRGLKHIGSGTTPSSGNKEYYENGNINWLNTGDFNDGILFNCKKRITQKALDENSALKIFKKGTLSIAMYGATIGKVCIIQFDATSNQACCNIEEGEIYSNKFLMYWFIGHKPHIVNLSYGGGQPNISQDVIKQLKVPCPDFFEQTAITNFLDYKLAKIDRFIKKKKQLIKLLNEQKAGIINDAVTKGLDANVKMKSSGIDGGDLRWLGDIPAHWEVRKLKYLGNFQNGISASAEYFGVGYPFVSYGDVYKNFELPKTGSGLANSSEQDRKNYSVKKGDVFFTRTSETIEEIGFTSTCLSTIENATFSGFIIRFRPSGNSLFDGFSKYYFRSTLHRRFFVKEMNIVIRASLSQDLLKKLPVLLPPLTEQKQIVSYIETETAKLNQIITTIETEIKLVQEYRTTLIAEAVTGKIDVRGYEIPVLAEMDSDEEMEGELEMVAEEDEAYETEEVV